MAMIPTKPDQADASEKFTIEALNRNKRQSMIIAVRARWAALAVIGTFLQFFNPNIEVLL